MIFCKRYALLLTAFTFATACSFQSPEDRGDTSASSTFELLAAHLTANPLMIRAADVQREKSYSVKACVRDRTTLKPVVAEEFVIRWMEGGREEITKTDAEGCLRWSESVSYAMTRHEQFISVTRQIEGRAQHSGAEILPLAFNPWLESTAGFLDARFQKIPEPVASARAENRERLRVTDLSARVRAEPSPDEILIDVSLTPKLVHWEGDSSREVEVNEGRAFQVRFFVVEESASGARVLAVSARSDVQCVFGKVTVEGAKMYVKRQPSLDLKRRLSAGGWYVVVQIESGDTLAAAGRVSLQPQGSFGPTLPVDGSELSALVVSAEAPVSKAERPLPLTVYASHLDVKYDNSAGAREFHLSDNLGLSQRRLYRFTLDITAERPASFSEGASQTFGFANGEAVEVDMAFLSPNLDPTASAGLGLRRYLCEFRTRGRIIAGKLDVVVPVELSFNEEVFLETGLEVYVEVRMPRFPHISPVTWVFPMEPSMTYQAVRGWPSALPLEEARAKLIPKAAELAEVSLTGELVGELRRPVLKDKPRDGYEQFVSEAIHKGFEVMDLTEGMTVDQYFDLQGVGLDPNGIYNKIHGLPCRSVTAIQPEEGNDLDALKRATHEGFLAATSTRVCHGEPKMFEMPRNMRFSENLKEPVYSEDGPYLFVDRVRSWKLKHYTRVQDQVATSLLFELESFEKASKSTVHTEGHENSTSATWSSSVSLNWKPGNIVGGIPVIGKLAEKALKITGFDVNVKAMGYSKEWSRETDFSQTTDVTSNESAILMNRRNRLVDSETMTFFTTKRTFEVEGDYHRCIAFLPNSSGPTFLTTGKRFLICARDSGSFAESWYYLSDRDPSQNPTIDRQRIQERIVATLRGDRAHQALKSSMSASIANYFRARRANAFVDGIASLNEPDQSQALLEEELKQEQSSRIVAPPPVTKAPSGIQDLLRVQRDQ